MATAVVSKAKSKADKASLVMSLITGTNKHYPTGSQVLSFGGATHTVTALTQLFQSFVDLRNAVIASQAATKAKVATERAQAPSLLVVIDEFVAFVKVTFGNQPDVLADFGLAPPKARAPQTAEQKAVAAAKRVATREARHTMGSNQKKGVKGAVTATLVVTPQAGSAPTVTAPAAVAPAPVAAFNGCVAFLDTLSLRRHTLQAWHRVRAPSLRVSVGVPPPSCRGRSRTS